MINVYYTLYHQLIYNIVFGVPKLNIHSLWVGAGGVKCMNPYSQGRIKNLLGPRAMV